LDKASLNNVAAISMAASVKLTEITISASEEISHPYSHSSKDPSNGKP
jgi:hypothetical protein